MPSLLDNVCASVLIKCVLLFVTSWFRLDFRLVARTPLGSGALRGTSEELLALGKCKSESNPPTLYRQLLPAHTQTFLLKNLFLLFVSLSAFYEIMRVRESKCVCVVRQKACLRYLSPKSELLLCPLLG